VDLERTVRALTPHIGAHVVLGDGERLGVSAAHVLPTGGPPEGELSLDGPRPVLGCAEGALELLIVQPPGRRPMSGEDYLRGRRR
jgi:methionyl-tRNA formyltransferase